MLDQALLSFRVAAGRLARAAGLPVAGSRCAGPALLLLLLFPLPLLLLRLLLRLLAQPDQLLKAGADVDQVQHGGVALQQPGQAVEAVGSLEHAGQHRCL